MEAPSPEVIDLAIPARPEVVSVARLVIGAIVAADPLFDEDRAADLRLAISEACTNAIQAQSAAVARTDVGVSAVDASTAVTMRCTCEVGSITVEVTDHAGGFDPTELRPHPDVTDPARLDYEGGLGIPLIRMLADELDFVATPDGTTVVMRFEPRGDDPGS